MRETRLSTPADSSEPRRLRDLVSPGGVIVLTGAGCSTESGIPDYRGSGRPRAGHPVQYREFIRCAETRQRYWARSFVGWPRVAAARPNPAHHALATLERHRLLLGVITQNVDGLHHAAGSGRIVELHGSLHWVRCLDCGHEESRAGLQRRLGDLNGDWHPKRWAPTPDGDADLPEPDSSAFRIACCLRCQGTLKPRVVFFGENVPPATTTRAWQLFDEARALLVVGSSLAVFSGYRFVKRAAERGLPIGLVNLGPTRGDGDAAFRLRAPAGEALSSLTAALGLG